MTSQHTNPTHFNSTPLSVMIPWKSKVEPVTPSGTRDESLVVTYMTSLQIRLMTILPAKWQTGLRRGWSCRSVVL